MATHTATFEIDTKSDAYAVERIMDTLYDSLREESRSVRTGSGDSTDMLAQFEEIRDATRRHSPGQFRIVYEPTDEEFDN